MHIYYCKYNKQALLRWTRNKRKEMLYLTTHSTHFYLCLYVVGHMLKDHSDSESGNLLLPHGLLFPINSKGSFICIIPQTGQHIAQPLLHQSWSTGWNEKRLNGSTHEGSIRRSIAPWAKGWETNAVAK